jgi:hypothetical protein
MQNVDFATMLPEIAERRLHFFGELHTEIPQVVVEEVTIGIGF